MSKRATVAIAAARHASNIAAIAAATPAAAAAAGAGLLPQLVVLWIVTKADVAAAVRHAAERAPARHRPAPAMTAVMSDVTGMANMLLHRARIA